MQEPLYELPARLGWQKCYGEIIFHPDAPYLILSLTPVFPFCSDQLAERGIVWDLWRLMESVRSPGAHYILNSECGYPPDAYLEQAVLVSHPDRNTVVWELDIPGLRPALEEAVSDEEGHIRLIFTRDEYESDIRAMLRDVQMASRATVPVEAPRNTYGHPFLVSNYPDLRQLPIGEVEPTVHGDLDLEEFAVLDAGAEWPRAPLFATGTVLEIGFFGHELQRLDGHVRHDWIGRWFTRWEVLAAFRRWIEYVSRRFALRWYGIQEAVCGDPNEFVLLPAHDSDACHRAGEAFADALRRALSEAETAPGVTVRYVRHDIAGVGTGTTPAPPLRGHQADMEKGNGHPAL